MSTVRLVTLTCRAGHTWERPAQPGRPPHTCPDHTLFGTRPEKGTPTPSTPRPRKKVGEHSATPILRQVVNLGEHIYLYGPSGTGKTVTAEIIADEMFGEGSMVKGSFHPEAAHPLLNAEDFFGFTTAGGDYVPGVVYDWLSKESGGILLLDEMDAANAALLVALNAVLALDPGKTWKFPNGEVLTRTERHVIIGGGNTNGEGATTAYKGRNALDAATLNRFFFLEFGYDERFERDLFGTDDLSDEWVRYCHAVRKAAQQNGAEVLVTMRTLAKGISLLSGGMSRKVVENGLIWKGKDRDTCRTIQTTVTAVLGN